MQISVAPGDGGTEKATVGEAPGFLSICSVAPDKENRHNGSSKLHHKSVENSATKMDHLFQAKRTLLKKCGTRSRTTMGKEQDDNGEEVTKVT